MLVENWLVEVVDTEVELVPRTKKLQSTITILKCKNNDYGGLFSEYGLT